MNTFLVDLDFERIAINALVLKYSAFEKKNVYMYTLF